jgi:hypothetical protein
LPTTRLTLPYPAATDPDDVPTDMQALANRVDTTAAMFAQGTAASRPTAGIQGRYYFATDTRVLSYDDGTNWRTIVTPRSGGLNGNGTTWYAGSGDWTATHPATGQYVITPTVALNTPVPVINAVAQTALPFVITAATVGYTSVTLNAWNVQAAAANDIPLIFAIWDL